MTNVVNGVRLAEPPEDLFDKTLAQDLVPGWYRCYGEKAPSLHVHTVRLDPIKGEVYLEYTQSLRPPHDQDEQRRFTTSFWGSPWHMVLDEYTIEELGLPDAR